MFNSMNWENANLITVPNNKGHTSNLWGNCPLYGGNATDFLENPLSAF